MVHIILCNNKYLRQILDFGKKLKVETFYKPAFVQLSIKWQHKYQQIS